MPTLLAFAVYILLPLSSLVDDSCFDKRELLSALATTSRLAVLYVLRGVEQSQTFPVHAAFQTSYRSLSTVESSFKSAALAASKDRTLAVVAFSCLNDGLLYATDDFVEAVADFYAQ